MKTFLTKLKKFHNLNIKIMLILITLTLLPNNKIYSQRLTSERVDAENRKQNSFVKICKRMFIKLSNNTTSKQEKIKIIKRIINHYLQFQGKENVHIFDYFFINTALEQLFSSILQIKKEIEENDLNDLLNLIKQCVEKIKKSNFNTNQNNKELFNRILGTDTDSDTVKTILESNELFNRILGTDTDSDTVEIILESDSDSDSDTDSNILEMIINDEITIENFNKLSKIPYKNLKKITEKSFVKKINKITNFIAKKLTNLNELSLQKLSLFNMALLSHITTRSIFGIFGRKKLKFISGSSFLDYNYFTRLQSIIELLNSLISVYYLKVQETHTNESINLLQAQISNLTILVKNELKILPKRIRQLSKEYVPTACNLLSRIINWFDTKMKKGFNYIDVKTVKINPLTIYEPISNFINCLQESQLVINEIDKEIIENITDKANEYYYSPIKSAYPNIFSYDEALSDGHEDEAQN